jgi:hypothetical protein
MRIVRVEGAQENETRDREGYRQGKLLAALADLTSPAAGKKSRLVQTCFINMSRCRITDVKGECLFFKCYLTTGNTGKKTYCNAFDQRVARQQLCHFRRSYT